MLLKEKEIIIPKTKNRGEMLKYFSEAVMREVSDDEKLIRFAVTKTDGGNHYCELGMVSEMPSTFQYAGESIFNFRKRGTQNNNSFNAALVIPTGIGAEIGGHSGDAGAVARLIASACDTLVTHPNVVNASDIMELPENGLYVEGSVLSRFLMGTAGLQRVRRNNVLFVVDEEGETTNDTINMVSAARACLGMDCSVVTMKDTIKMESIYMSSGRATGKIGNLDGMCKIISEYVGGYDAIALSTKMEVEQDVQINYYKSGGEIINPWGGAEAMLTHFVSSAFNLPSAHSPFIPYYELESGIIDPRIAAEEVSITFLFCILKGLNKSPKIISDPVLFCRPEVMTANDLSCIIIPDGCIGLPTLAALEQGIPVIAVKENKNIMKNNLEELPFGKDKLYIVENYWEAVGIMNALKAGVAPNAVRRPLAYTDVIRE